MEKTQIMACMNISAFISTSRCVSEKMHGKFKYIIMVFGKFKDIIWSLANLKI